MAVVFVFLIVMFINGCVKEYSNQPIPNIQPKTFFWIYPDSTISAQTSKQKLHWWGEDPDGYVIGYLLSLDSNRSTIPNPDSLVYTYVTVTDSTIRFPIQMRLQNFLVAIRAIDNTFSGLQAGAKVRLWPKPYWDKNENGILDSGDKELSSLTASMDPVGAKQQFPIKNTPPTVAFAEDPIEQTTIQQPETTFTVATFGWTGSDVDGDETIAGYRFGLNDTSTGSWFSVSSGVKMVTLIVPRSVSNPAEENATVSADVYSGTFPDMKYLGKVSGMKLNSKNIFYVQSRDIAGDYSSRQQLPAQGKTWFVKKPKSRLLIVCDYKKEDSTQVRSFYSAKVGSVAGGLLANPDELDIRIGGTTTTFGNLVPKLFNPAFVQTLKLYDYVLWYSDRFPTLRLAQVALYHYASTGGKVIYTTDFLEEFIDPSRAIPDFTPLDSVCSFKFETRPFPPAYIGDTRIPAGYVVQPDSSDLSNIYPTLVLNNTRNPHLITLRPVYKSSNARYILRMQADTRTPMRYYGRPNVGVIDNAKSFVFFGLPLHLFDAAPGPNQGVVAFFNKVFVDEFGLK